MLKDQSSYDNSYFEKYLVPGALLGRMRASTLSHRYWSRFLKKHLSTNDLVLEVGCGLGFLGRKLAEDFTYTGIDISQDALKFAKERNELSNVILADAAERLPVASCSFCAVLAFDVLEHLLTPGILVDDIHRVLKPGGWFIGSTPKPRSIGVRLKSRSKYLVPSMHTDETHVSLLTIHKWREILECAGFIKVRSGTDFLWDVPYISWLPRRMQQMALLPLHLLSVRFMPILPWSLGENFVFVYRKPYP